jgi:hypothetical protein
MKCVTRGGKMGGFAFEFSPPPEEIDVPHFAPDNSISRYRQVGKEICRRKSTGKVLFERMVYEFVGVRRPFVESIPWG